MELREETSMNATATASSTTIWFIDNLARVALDAETTGGAFDVVEIEGREGDMPPLHVHRDHDEAFHVLEGRLTVHLPGRVVDLGPGEALFAPRDVPHAYRVESERAKWLAVSTPARFASFVREAGEEPEHDGFPALDREHDVAALAAAAARHGIELLGPPGAVPA
jgi:quercetin dioxygenase-like cupin family protein